MHLFIHSISFQIKNPQILESKIFIWKKNSLLQKVLYTQWIKSGRTWQKWHKNKAFGWYLFDSLSVNPTKWSNTLKQLVTISNELFECFWAFCGAGS